MTCGEMIDYLKQWDKDKHIEFCLANPAERVFYEIRWIKGITDLREPAICIEISGSTPFNEELRKAAEEDEAAGVEVHA